MSAPNVQQQPALTSTNLASDIQSVTVYRSGASVTRVAALPPAEAPNAPWSSVRFDDLPLSLVDSSLRCRLVGSSGLRATELRCALRLPSARSGGLSERHQERRAMQVKLQQLRGRLAFVEEEIALKLSLEGRGKPAPGEPPIGSPLAARLALLARLDARLVDLHAQREIITEEVRVAQLALDALLAAEELESTDREARVGELRKSVLVALDGVGHTPNTRIELEYFVPGARWAPSYALRLGAGLRDGELAMRAMVSQRSGEDWRGVQMTLSTADHQRWAEIPELNSRRIGRRQPPPSKKGWRAPPIGTDLLYRDYDASFGGPSEVAPSRGGRGPGRPERARDMEREEMAKELSYARRDEPAVAGGLFEDAAPAFEEMADDEFDDFGTAVMEVDAIAEANAFVEPPEPAPMPMASMAAPPSAPMRSRMSGVKSKKMARAPGFAGSPAPQSRPAPRPAALAQPEVDLEALQYARLRMEAPGSRARGSLHIRTRMEVYAEVFLEEGESLDYETRTQIESAHGRAEDIAAMPTGHREPWSEDFDYAYRAENTVDLASDGQFHSLPIAGATAQCTPLHVVVPRESTDVFRTVKVDNPMEAPLLAGPMDIYWDDAFLLTSAVAFTAPKGEVELGLGVDQAVKVVRNTHYREDTTGLMSGSLELTHKIVIEVANEGGHDIALEVRERVPVAASDEDDIKLEIKGVSPAWTAFDPKSLHAGAVPAKGSYCWQVPLASGQRTELNATYEIKIPSKYELSGGNRREW